MGGYGADDWRGMCDEFEKDGVWADHLMLPFASKLLDMEIEIMPALPNPEGSDHFNHLKFTHGLSAEKQHMSCVVGWLNGSHYTMTMPMQEKVQLRSHQLDLDTVLFQYDSPCAQLAETFASQFNQDGQFSNVHAQNWVAQDTVNNGDCLPYTLAA